MYINAQTTFATLHCHMQSGIEFRIVFSLGSCIFAFWLACVLEVDEDSEEVSV